MYIQKNHFSQNCINAQTLHYTDYHLCLFAKPPVLASGMHTQHIHSLHACLLICPHVCETVVYHRFCFREICERHVCANLFRSIAGAKPLCQWKYVTLLQKIIDQRPVLSCKQWMDTICLSIHARLVCLLNPTWMTIKKKNQSCFSYYELIL